jgi:hypothetical protein
VKEIINSHQDKKGFLRNATATGAMLVALVGCGEPPIKEGTVFQKQHIEAHTEEKPVWMKVGSILTYGLFNVTALLSG